MANTSGLQPDNVWQRFTHPVARDLAWIIASPALMSNRLKGFTALEFDQDTKNGCIEWLTHLEHHSPDRLAIDRISFRQLGLYFEALIAFLFSEGWHAGVAPYRLLGRNIQVSEGNVTIGELDMLLEDTQGIQIHLECAVKFYLAHRPQLGDWRNWVGPNGRDRLDIKLQRLLNHQLTLTKHPAAQQLLTSRGLDAKNISSRYFLRGMFFPHPESIHYLPMYANPEVLTGRWLHREPFTTHYGENSRLWAGLPKINWLGGTGINQDQIKNMVDPLPKMLVRNIGGGDIVEHMMLVENYWPDISSPSRRI